MAFSSGFARSQKAVSFALLAFSRFFALIFRAIDPRSRSGQRNLPFFLKFRISLSALFSFFPLALPDAPLALATFPSLPLSEQEATPKLPSV
jgi:hypothetical protein